MRRRGLSLAETLLSVAIIAILGGVLIMLYNSAYQAYYTGTTHLALQQRARTTMQRISLELKNAIQPSESGQAVEAPGMGATASEVVFNRPAASFEKFDPRAPVYAKRRVRFSNRRVLLDDNGLGAIPEELLGRDIEACEFKHVAANAVRVTLKLKGQIRGEEGVREVPYEIISDVQIPYYALSR
ncbi:MAG: hypothetical protein FJW37_12900 [Acidobacteria bacterium]|nr:hypothetical protein [Acidobacteriota bacterium]